MGFWDFIAPDYDGFKAALEAVIPESVGLGPVVLARDQLIDLAWLNPASAAGLAGRLFYQNGNVQGANQASGSSLVQAQLDNLMRGGAYPIGPNTVGTDLTLGVGMAPVVVPNVYAGTVKAAYGGQPVLNTLHFQGTAPGAEAACAAAFQTAWKQASGPLSLWNSAYGLVEFEVVDLSSTGGGIFVIVDSTTGTRVVTGTAGRQTSALVSYNGTTRNRSQRGRTYLGPLYEADIQSDGATLETARQTIINNAMTLFRSSMNTAGFPMVVLSRKLLTAYAITAQRTENIIATQRRRLR
jgi:hypothetical protein